jgi:hypothetical protein
MVVTRDCVEGEREVTARHGGRASVLMRVARCSGDVAVAAALRGGDTEVVCPYAIGEVVIWTEGKSMWPHDTPRCASAPWLRGYAHAPAGLCRGLDGALSAVLVRPAEQAARGFIVELLAWAS